MFRRILQSFSGALFTEPFGKKREFPTGEILNVAFPKIPNLTSNSNENRIRTLKMQFTVQILVLQSNGHLRSQKFVQFHPRKVQRSQIQLKNSIELRKKLKKF